MTGWNPSTFPTGVSETIETGRRLSVIIHCPVRLVSWEKPQYECWHEVVFAKFFVEGSIQEKQFDRIRQQHDDMVKQLGAGVE